MSKFTIRFDDAPVGTTHVVLRWSVKDRCIKHAFYKVSVDGVESYMSPQPDNWCSTSCKSLGDLVQLAQELDWYLVEIST